MIRKMFSRMISATKRIRNKTASAVPLLAILLSIVVLSSFKITLTTGGTGDVEFYVDPATTTLYDTSPIGTRFNITVMWKDTGTPLTDAFAWQVILNINTTILNCTRAWQPTWDANYLLKPREPNWMHPPPDGLGTDTITIMASLSPEEIPPVQAASARLAIFELEVVYTLKAGDSLLLRIDSEDTIWMTDNINWYIPVRTNGNVQVVSTRAWFEVSPSSVTLGPGPANGTEFTVDVNITGPPPSGLDADLFVIGAQSRLYYNSTLLAPVGIEEGPFFRDPAWNLYGTWFLGSFESDGSGTYALVGDVILPNSTTGVWDQMSFPNGTGSIARTRFKAIKQDPASLLDCNLTLGDNYGQPWLYNATGDGILIDASRNVNCHYTMLPFSLAVGWRPTCPLPYVPSNITRADEPTLVEANVSSPINAMHLSYRVDGGEWWNTSTKYNATMNSWRTEIPGQSNDSRTVEFFVIAYGDSGSLQSPTYSFSIRALLGSDINGDGRVDVRDVAYVCKDYGKKGP